jgi:hypothetical protein
MEVVILVLQLVNELISRLFRAKLFSEFVVTNLVICRLICEM